MTKEELIDRIIARHFEDCSGRQAGFLTGDDKAVHEFRLACKRLRFAIDRFEISSLQKAAKKLAKITDDLGAAHDCVLLAKRARKIDAPAVAHRALQDCDGYVLRARELWFSLYPALERRIA